MNDKASAVALMGLLAGLFLGVGVMALSTPGCNIPEGLAAGMLFAGAAFAVITLGFVLSKN